MSRSPDISLDNLAARIESLPGVSDLRAAAASRGVRAWLVGGAVRDLLLGAEPLDLDLVVAGDPFELAEGLGGDVRSHQRFATATVLAPAGDINIAGARTESYAAPGALPDVEPTAEIESDLSRRDFTVNAIAVALDDPSAVIDPHGGVDDLRAEVLRVLHQGSFADDPTRAIRAARYSVRLRLELDPRTLDLVKATDLATVSEDRIEAELRRLALEPDPRAGFERLHDWGLIALGSEAGERIDAAVELARVEPWTQTVTRADLVRGAAREPSARVTELAASDPGRPSIAVAIAAGFDPVELALARILGATWLDRYVAEWGRVELEISGADLIAAGLSEGPALGRGLEAALRAKLDGRTAGREDELRLAIDAARKT